MADQAREMIVHMLAESPNGKGEQSDSTTCESCNGVGVVARFTIDGWDGDDCPFATAPVLAAIEQLFDLPSYLCFCLESV